MTFDVITNESNAVTVIIYEAGDTLATVLNLPLSKAEPTVAGRREKQVTVRLSGFSFASESSDVVSATCSISEPPCFLSLSEATPHRRAAARAHQNAGGRVTAESGAEERLNPTENAKSPEKTPVVPDCRGKLKAECQV